MTLPEILKPATIVSNVSFALEGLIADRDGASCRAVAFFLKVYRSTAIYLHRLSSHLGPFALFETFSGRARRPGQN
jgi:hypothetical protein